MTFTRAELLACEGGSVPDLIGPGCTLLFVGINPGLWTVAAQTHFSHPSNRFYPALRLAGVIDIDVDPAAGMDDSERAHFVERGIGITNLVERATIRASELSAEELREGHDRLERFVDQHRPRVVAVAGITAYRTAFRRPKATTGQQPERIGDAEVWVVPNPSGLNAHETVESLAQWYRMVGVAGGVISG